MLRKRLEQLSVAELQRLADREGVRLPEDAEKDELVDILLDFYEERREERELFTNHPMRIEQRKYEISLDEEIDYGEEEFPFPREYNRTGIYLLLRDPSWAFCYWEIPQTFLVRLKKEEFGGLFLRVHRGTMDGEGFLSEESFVIPVQLQDRSWYINIPVQGAAYRVDLITMEKDREVLLCRSNVVHVPVPQVKPKRPGEVSLNSDILISISALHNRDELFFPDGGVDSTSSSSYYGG
ncbi:DUF4912 domain-containing protein [Spirochaeta thermophila]|uniref:DUF4912 domain-containing protein n=1 Tax=Winmispira thermophila (strain ATCC 49972 / DSM 6192 / RI 19.B1) TaxID=665571 RepID=E0RS49_WINT6|nr:DUF4912 domain-containing protein [Spirochaeta thermophila]ADN01836.1 hypothetical protein STHERM_c08890 [Spirochaeta thermophila DSM 6192]